VFRVNTDGTGFSTLHTFTGTSGFPSTNSDGAFPLAALTLSGSTLYGTTGGGGTSGYGTVFAINTDGTGFTNLHSFMGVNGDGTIPNAGVILSGDTLSGMTTTGGDSGVGTVFKVNTDGTGYTILHSFSGGSEGAFPGNGLVSWGVTLYGQTAQGGSSGAGTIFRVNTDGTGFMTLHTFTPLVSGTNSDGAEPLGSFVFSTDTVWDHHVRRQFGRRHSVQYSHPATTDNNSFRPIRDTDVANELHRIYFGIHDEPRITSGLDHDFTGSGPHRCAKRRYQYRLWNTAVLPVKPVTSNIPN
jgi:uncharacterized repeat protein (TIGR03803 family)